MYKNVNDYELLYLISESDEEAYNSLYQKYGEMIKMEAKKLYYSYRYLGISWDDIYQAGLYGLNSAIKNFDEHKGVLFYTYVKIFVKHEFQTLIRDHSREKHNVLSNSISLDKEIDDDGNCIDSLIDAKVNNIEEFYTNERMKQILNFKYELSFLNSLIYELKINNFTNKEISILLDLDYKKVDNAIHSIKNKLRKKQNVIEV